MTPQPHYDDNVSWEPPVPAWEPWEDYGDDEPELSGGCAYCPATEVRESPEPFGGQKCCDRCFARLIGDESDDPQPWRCGEDVPAIRDGIYRHLFAAGEPE